MFTWILSYQYPSTIIVFAMAGRVCDKTVILYNYASAASSRVLSCETFG